MRAVLILVALCCAAPASAQQVLLDKGARVNGLWCFPVAANPREYVYLPSQVKLAEDEAGRPQFSFVRYVINASAAGAEGSSITDAQGGGVLHFLVLMDTPADLVSGAQQALRRDLKDDELKLRGPIVFSDGTYALVSSVLNPAGGPPERKLLANGRAPVLEGNRLAFSFDLKPQEATLLMQNLQMNTPDVSLVFDMTFSGLSEAYDAELFIDWSEVRKTQAFGAGVSVYFVGVDVEASFDDMRRNNAIRLRSSGSDSAMEGLLTTVYSKLLELMFRKVEPDKVPPDQRGGFMDAMSALIDPKGPLGARKTTGFGLNVAYQLKDLRSSGTSVLNFNHRAAVERHSFVTFNIGDLYRRFGRDANYFRAVNLSDPTFQQREIHVGLDGALVSDFDRYINAVTVTLRKQHQNGQETLRELVLDRGAVAKASGDLRMIYGWNGDDDRTAWLGYDYRTRWSFKGGGAYQTEWIRADTPMIDLFAPYERRVVQVVGAPDMLLKQHVRAVVVLIEYEFFGEHRRHQIVLRPDRPAEEQQVQITLPLGRFQYAYNVTWQLDGNRRVTRQGQDTTGVVFVDEVPAGSNQD